MEYVEGESLADYIASTSAAGRPPPPAEAVQLFTALARAIDTAHQHGIVHGNIKPTNILLKHNITTVGRTSTPMLTDFGATTLLPNRNGHTIPYYLAPEQIKGAPARERSDIYALGVILYELYTGVPPFRGNRPVAVMMQHINAQPTPPDLVNPTLSPALTQVYQDAKQLVQLAHVQLLQPSALTLLDDLTTQAQYAYTGRPDLSNGTSPG